MFVDSGTGSIQDVTVPTGTPDGLGWLDARSLVLNHPTQLGAPRQLLRQPYPDGPLSRLTNDPNDYVGISLSGDRRRLVTTRQDARMDLWVGDGEATTGADVVQRVPISLERVAWAGDRLLYGGVIGGKPAILRVTPGENTPEDVVLEALAPHGDERWPHDRVRLDHRQLPGPLDRGCERSPEDAVGPLGDRQPRGHHARRSVRALHLARWGNGVDLDGVD